MADLNQMKAAAAAQGATAPPEYPGGADAWVADWYQNAVNAGSLQGTRTQGEATATDATTGSTPQGYKNTGTSTFADMIRKKSKDEGWSEDFERFSDAQIDAWQKYYDPSTGKFKSENDPSGAATYDKPAECPPGTTFHGSKCVSWDSLPEELGGTGGGGGGGKGGKGPAAAGPPPPPTTFGSQLSYTGNPLTDMLLYQFNSGSQLSDPSKMNTFALGQDRQEEGAGADADQQKRTGQLLQGGGLWWQEGAGTGEQDAFGGFRADTKNAEGQAPAAAVPQTLGSGAALGNNFTGGGSTKPQPSESIQMPDQAQAGAPPSSQPAAGIGDMLTNQRRTWRNKAGGEDSPFEARAF